MLKQTLFGGKRDVVAIGASAGGLAALTEVLSALPSNLPACLLIVQHLDPKRSSMMADILNRHSALQVTEAHEGDRCEPEQALIAPPDHHMLVSGDIIHLTKTELVHFVRPSVDLLFESVAASFGSRAIGIVLTGSGTDGALGIQAIRAKGGLTIVENPETATTSGMPTAAVATGAVDLVLQLKDIGPAIVDALGKEGQENA